MSPPQIITLIVVLHISELYEYILIFRVNNFELDSFFSKCNKTYLRKIKDDRQFKARMSSDVFVVGKVLIVSSFCGTMCQNIVFHNPDYHNLKRLTHSLFFSSCFIGFEGSESTLKS
jgi:hypothetical protein